MVDPPSTAAAADILITRSDRRPGGRSNDCSAAVFRHVNKQALGEQIGYTSK